MDDFLNSFVTEVISDAKQNRVRIEADYNDYVAKQKSNYDTARTEALEQGKPAPAEPVISPAPKSATALAPTIRANTMVARVYPMLGGIAVQGDESEGELAIVIFDEDGEVLARYSGIRGH